jgi:hypothetical protein
MEFLLIFYCITGTACGISSTDNKSAQSGENLNVEANNVDFSYYNYFFGLNSWGNTIITRCGKLPELETEDQKESWNSNLEELSNNIKDTVASKYMYPHGDVVTCGINAKGYFVILFKYGNVDESLINDIYTLIDNSAKEMGIQGIPVEFGYGIYQAEIPLDRKYGIYHEFGESTENLSESDIHIIEEYMKGKPEQFRGEIASYGKIPLLKDKTDINSWGNKLFSIKSITEEKISPYFDRGQVIAYGIELTRLFVTISDDLSSEEKAALVEEIYQIIDEGAIKQNVIDIPVAFESGHYQLDELVAEDVGAVEEPANFSTSRDHSGELNNSNNSDSESDNGISSGGNEFRKNNSASSFGLLGNLICLYAVRKLRKK